VGTVLKVARYLGIACIAAFWLITYFVAPSDDPVVFFLLAGLFAGFCICAVLVMAGSVIGDIGWPKPK
jgi:hypothetical protein